MINDNIENNYPCEILSPYHFTNSTLIFPSIGYQGEITLTENEKGGLKELASSENPSKEKILVENEKDPFEIFHGNRFPSDVLINDFMKNPDNFVKLFKIKLKGYFFASNIKVLS